MKNLLQTNPYLADPREREQMLIDSVLDSSAFEGAKGLTAQVLKRKVRVKASTKKAVKGR